MKWFLMAAMFVAAVMVGGSTAEATDGAQFIGRDRFGRAVFVQNGRQFIGGQRFNSGFRSRSFSRFDNGFNRGPVFFNTGRRSFFGGRRGFSRFDSGFGGFGRRPFLQLNF